MSTVAELTITRLEHDDATDEEIFANWEFFSQLRAERQPDDPPFPWEDFVASWRNHATHVRELIGMIQEPESGKIIGRASVWLNSKDNVHMAWIDLGVLPEHRRQGLGRRLFGWAAEESKADGRNLILLESNGRVPAGAIMAERMQARPGLEARVSQLVLSEVDREQMRSWKERAAERAEGFEIGFWDGPFPEDELPAIVELLKVMNTAPRDNLELEDEDLTSEMLREHERNMEASGSYRWVVYAREKATGDFAGFTEIFARKSIPSVIWQGGTGVYPRFRNLGLGRWLKADMIERVLDNMPEAKFVRTGNAESNGPMLGINVAMGFKPYLSEMVWQIGVEEALAYAS